MEKKVPENVLKKRARDAKHAEATKAERERAKSERKEKRELYFKHAEQYFHEYQKHDQDLVQAKRSAKAEGSIFVEPEAKVALVVRTKGIMKIAPTPKKVLQLLRLRQINNAVFIIVNKATLNMLKRTTQLVTFGYPSLKTIRELIYKRGFAKVNGQRVPLSDNEIIEKELGKYGIICIEDLVHEIATCGPHFRESCLL